MPTISRGFVCLLLCSAGQCAALLRDPIPAARTNRRAALRGALVLPIAVILAPSSTQAKCICKSVTNCECTEDAPDAKSRTVKRADAAGRDFVEGKQAREQFMRELEEEQQPEITRTKAAPRKEPSQPAAPPPPPPQYEQGSATRALARARGLESQEFSEINPSSAKGRFALVVEDAIRKREAKLGFELDKEDIDSLISILRIKYCGPQGQIGPC